MKLLRLSDRVSKWGTDLTTRANQLAAAARLAAVRNQDRLWKARSRRSPYFTLFRLR